MFNSISIWFIIGILLLLSEFLIPGFTIFFFGLGAIITSIILLIIPPLQGILWVQILIFTTSSILLLIYLRKHFTKALRGEIFKERDDYTGQECKVVEGISPGKPGRVKFHGTTWVAESENHKFNKNNTAVIIGKKHGKSMVFIIDILKKDEENK
jgi:inner membrane protein